MRRVVVKLGSSVVADSEGALRLAVLAGVCDLLAVQRREQIADTGEHLEPERALAVCDDARSELHDHAPHEWSLFAFARVELKRDAGDLDLISRLEPLGLERPEHADAAQATLEIRHRIVVLDVVALE